MKSRSARLCPLSLLLLPSREPSHLRRFQAASGPLPGGIHNPPARVLGLHRSLRKIRFVFNEDGYCEAGTIRNSHREEDEEQVPRLTTFKFLEDRPDLMNRRVSLLPLPGILDAEVDVAALHVSGLRANEILGL